LDPADRIEPLVFPGGAGTEGVAEWLKETGPDAVVNALPGVYEIVVSLGVEIPRRLAFVHLDVPESLRAQGVCGIDQLSREVGAIAAELVSTQLYTNTAGIPEHPTTQLINGAWVEGRTIGLPLGPARRRKSGVGR
jgi:hypothetical protein